MLPAKIAATATDVAAASRSGATIMTNDKAETFGEWLLAQCDREGWIGNLVKAARADSRSAAAARLSETQARSIHC
jgi:hypothetical protein